VFNNTPTPVFSSNLVNKSYDENYLGLVYHLALIAGGYELENNNEFLSNVYQYI
jgi:hypothetical protein